MSLFAINKKVNIYASEGDNILDENEIIDYLNYEEDDATVILTNSGKRIRLAQDVLETVFTLEVGAVGNKDTLTVPGDYVSAFNKLIKNYGLENNIAANLNGSILLGGHEDEYMAIIEYDIESLSVTKISPKNYNVLFPKYTSRFRFFID